ncbi:MAG: GntR family transcriptional regulator, partial [Actinobacteria bacterium]|nr:GntR family transcriptional regulator [Actinomycetota bacterium]
MATPMTSLSARALSQLLAPVTESAAPIYLALADGISALIRDGRIAPDSRLPSERSLASTLSLSRATVTGAYDRLRELGLLASRTGAGSFVTIPPGQDARYSLARWNPASAPTDVIDLSCAALPAPTGLLPGVIARALPTLDRLAAQDGYDPIGLTALRTAIAARFSARGVPTGPEQIMITNGALHAIDLVLRLLVGPGDRVLT